MEQPRHVSVLLSECIENLNIRPDGIYVDGTLGLGGHSYEIASRLREGRLIGIDRDPSAIERAGRRLEPFRDRITLVHGNFGDVAKILDERRSGAFPICWRRRWTCAWTVPLLSAPMRW